MLILAVGVASINKPAGIITIGLELIIISMLIDRGEKS